MEEPIVSAELFPGIYKPIKFNDLPWEEQATFMWSWYWRALIIGILTIWLATFFGTFVGMYIKILVGELHSTVVTTLGYAIGMLIGFLGVHPTVKLLTMGKMGDYQVVILKRQSPSASEGAG